MNRFICHCFKKKKKKKSEEFLIAIFILFYSDQNKNTIYFQFYK